MDRLLDRGLTCVTVLDISGAALARAKARVGTRTSNVTWIEADVTGDWPVGTVDIWHDRAVLHFLVDPVDRRRYIDRLRGTLRRGGHAIIATFALEGPPRCSGLPVVRYSPETLSADLGAGFALRDAVRDEHRTPAGAAQAFWYMRFVKGE